MAGLPVSLNITFSHPATISTTRGEGDEQHEQGTNPQQGGRSGHRGHGGSRPRSSGGDPITGGGYAEFGDGAKRDT
jgi:hypothetical protein